MAATDHVNVRIATDVAEELTRRADIVGMSRQEYVDHVLRREILYGPDPWAKPVAAAPGLLPEAGELRNAERTGQHFAFLFRDLRQQPTVVVGAVQRVLPVVIYIQPAGHRTLPIPLGDLVAWEPYSTESELFEILPGWVLQGARPHPWLPRTWLERLQFASPA